MSKAKAAGRDKLSSNAAAVPQAPPVREIVPGRFTEKDWNELVNDEIDSDVVASILDEVVVNAWDVLYQKAIEKALWPYTAEWVRDTVEIIVEWQFLERDEGETDTHMDPNWIEDEEPAPAEIDAWARGAVPKTKIKIARPETAQTQIAEIQPEVNKSSEKTTQLSDEVLDPQITISVQKLPTTCSNSDSRPPKQRKKKFTKAAKQAQKVGVFEGDATDQATETATQVTLLERKANDPLHASASILKAQYGRPPGRKDVVYDSKGNVTQAVRLHPANFPSHRAKTRFAVVDKADTQFDNSSQMAPHRPAHPQWSHKPPARRMRFKEGRKQIDSPQETAPLTVSLIDSINLSAGVVVREAGRRKEGVKNVLDRIPRPTFPLQPITSLDTKDIADAAYVSSGSLVIRPVSSVPVGMPDRRPIPPIVTSSRHQNVST